ncbi:hypothetical protein lacNasYZ03_08620 [Lactobacillus nasalidis]|uniref:L,D-TPase catalytic domain-containing protein n=1 Tax=Lactobacillus nasalidis TaxID=2797258 RepID=A0ABQ3W3X6_9LACO|nr:L,D-transpeptidase family protein [Lactobacillus nasalidis]GHV97035.1 hypothetical protein lacNasYZ01_02170 [Lactobacillus nasalidis]GHW00264.1 hypothetical protein lacNasYZ02_16930 [Lactobacillus nasalidis]GHW01175.1 hypothetical protein lacNasYZ03_08620 [Lactobacillus nasalidis]
MTSRKDYRKKNIQGSKYLVIAGVAVIALACAGIWGHNAYQQHQATVLAQNKRQVAYNKKHFNANVSIFGVKVGKLTVAQATKKIQAKAKNKLVYKNGKISAVHDSKVAVISQSTVQKYFDKQYTQLPTSKSYKYQNTSLAKGKSKLKQLMAASVDYKVAGKTFTLPAKTYLTQVSYYSGAIHYDDSSKLTTKLNAMDKEVKTLGKSYKFTTPSGSTITVTNQSYGWGIWTASAKKAVLAAYESGKKTIDGKNHIYGEGYTTQGLGYGKSNNGLGNSYVVVSISSQDLWVVVDGKVAVTVSDVVTGTANKGDNATPKGVWYIMYKQQDATLKGQNDDGSNYSSKVDYWMPFTLSGCGLHDASWRTDWSSTAYLEGGSHGCVNIRPSEIKSVWNAVTTHMPVIVY